MFCLKCIALFCFVFFASDNIICYAKYVTQESLTFYLFIVLIGPIWGVISDSNIYRDI